MARDTKYTIYSTGRTDPTYKNIWAFADRMERTAFLALKPHREYTENKYWKFGQPVKIAISYEDSFQYDYIMITNRPDTENEKTYYCFITSRAYLSPEATLFVLDVDYVQTYYFSKAIDEGLYPFWQVSGFLESGTFPSLHPPRGTVSEFPISARVCNSYQSTSYQGDLFAIVIYSSYDLAGLYNSDVVQTQVGVINNIPMTALPYMIVGTSIASIATVYNTLFEKINSKGITDSVTGVYLLPQNFVNLASTQLNTVTLSYSTKNVDITIIPPVNCDGYTPVNSELLGYDYSYFFVSNSAGEVMNYHYEDFTGNPQFRCSVTLNAGYPVLICQPLNYKFGTSGNFRSFIQKITTPIQSTYLNDSYKIWLAQTQNSRQAAIDGAQLAIGQAEEARNTSWAYQHGQFIKDMESRYKSSITGTLADVSGTLSSFLETGGMSLLGGGGNRATRGAGAGRRFGDVNIPYGGSQMMVTPTYASRYGDDQQAWGAVYDIVTGYMNHQMGIENIYQYDHAVQNAQQAMNQLLAGYKDKAALPVTVSGSNAYGDLTTYQQYAFQFICTTPTAEYAEWVDKALSASGHTINKYLSGSVTKQHTVFDFVRLLSPHIERDPENRPSYVHNLLMQLLINGVYLWYLDNQGDISEYIGAPYGLSNPTVI